MAQGCQLSPIFNTFRNISAILPYTTFAKYFSQLLLINEWKINKYSKMKPIELTKAIGKNSLLVIAFQL